MAVSGSDGSIILTTQIDTSGINKGLKSIDAGVKSTSNVLARMGGLLATAFSVNALMNFSKASSQVAMDAEASAQRIISIFGRASVTIGDFIDANARALGMSRSAAAALSVPVLWS